MSWGSNAVRHCKRLHNYAAAHAFFTGLARPRGTKWHLDERPLYSNRAHHYHIVKGAEGYDLVLYNTSLVRYLAPNKVGEEVVLLRGYDSVSSLMFLDTQGWDTWHSGVRTTEDEVVHIPLCAYPRRVTYGGIPADWCAKLVMVGGRLDVSKSAHYPAYVKCATEGDSESRAVLKERMAHLIRLMCLRIEQFDANCDTSIWAGIPFQGINHVLVRQSNGFGMRRTVQGMVAAFTQVPGHEPEREEIDAFVGFSQAVYSVAIARRWHNSAAFVNSAQQPPLDAPSFERSLTAALIKLSPAGVNTGKQQLPFFSTDKLPSKYFFK